MGAMLQQDRCTQNDYVRLFADSSEPLQWLCYTLTGDKTLSEKVLGTALEQSLKGANQVFRDWMVSWARRLVIKACIESVRPWKSSLAQVAYQLYPMRLDAIDSDRLVNVISLSPEILQQRLFRLDVLSRFVFVLRALEGYIRRETALLLNIDDRLCEWTYLRAARQLYDEPGRDAVRTNESPHASDWVLFQAGD